MNKIQWGILGFGLIIMSGFLFKMAPICLMSDPELLSACYIQRYSYAVPAIISFFLGIIFSLVGLFASKK